MNPIKNEGQIGLSAVTIEKDTHCDLQMISLFYFTFLRENKSFQLLPRWKKNLVEIVSSDSNLKFRKF